MTDEIIELNNRLIIIMEKCHSVGAKGEDPEIAVEKLVDRYCRFVENFRKGVNCIMERANA